MLRHVAARDCSTYGQGIDGDATRVWQGFRGGNFLRVSATNGSNLCNVRTF
jgi:hypothetical protein